MSGAKCTPRVTASATFRPFRITTPHPFGDSQLLTSFVSRRPTSGAPDRFWEIDALPGREVTGTSNVVSTESNAWRDEND